MLSPECLLLRLFEILILENIRRGANETEAHQVSAGIASGKRILTQQDYFMRGAVTAIMNHLIDAGFAHGFTRAEKFSGAVWLGSGVRARLAAAFCVMDDAASRESLD